MNGLFRIRNLRVHCLFGCDGHEMKRKQELIVDLTYKVDLSECVQTDSLADSIDYVEVSQVLEEVAQAEHFHLIETYAHEALHALFSRFPFLYCKIRVKKKGALPLADYVSCEFEREV